MLRAVSVLRFALQLRQSSHFMELDDEAPAASCSPIVSSASLRSYATASPIFCPGRNEKVFGRVSRLHSLELCNIARKRLLEEHAGDKIH